MARMVMEANRIDVRYMCKACGNLYNTLSAIRRHTRVKHIKQSLYNNTIGVYSHTTKKEVQKENERESNIQLA